MKQINFNNTNAKTIRDTLPRMPSIETLLDGMAHDENYLVNAEGAAMYAAYLDHTFQSAVFHAFTAAARGNGEEAVKIARAVMKLNAKEAV